MFISVGKMILSIETYTSLMILLFAKCLSKHYYWDLYFLPEKVFLKQVYSDTIHTVIAKIIVRYALYMTLFYWQKALASNNIIDIEDWNISNVKKFNTIKRVRIHQALRPWPAVKICKRTARSQSID